MNEICLQNEWLEKLNFIINKNIVDSNVFLRSLILSHEKFDHLQKKKLIFCEKNIFLSFFEIFPDFRIVLTIFDNFWFLVFLMDFFT